MNSRRNSARSGAISSPIALSAARSPPGSATSETVLRWSALWAYAGPTSTITPTHAAWTAAGSAMRDTWTCSAVFCAPPAEKRSAIGDSAAVAPQRGAPEAAPRSHCPMSLSAPRVAVFGAGAFGGWAALALVRRGAAVTLVDGWGPGNTRASSGGSTRVIRATYGSHTLYTRMAADALQRWREYDARWNGGLLHGTGALWLVSADTGFAESSAVRPRERRDRPGGNRPDRCATPVSADRVRRRVARADRAGRRLHLRPACVRARRRTGRRGRRHSPPGRRGISCRHRRLRGELWRMARPSRRTLSSSRAGRGWECSFPTSSGACPADPPGGLLLRRAAGRRAVHPSGAPCLARATASASSTASRQTMVAASRWRTTRPDR